MKTRNLVIAMAALLVALHFHETRAEWTVINPTGDGNATVQRSDGSVGFVRKQYNGPTYIYDTRDDDSSGYGKIGPSSCSSDSCRRTMNILNGD